MSFSFVMEGELNGTAVGYLASFFFIMLLKKKKAEEGKKKADEEEDYYYNNNRVVNRLFPKSIVYEF